MSLEVGAVYEGKVTGITSFGAFVSLPERHSGLVHISEVANAYVNDIHQFLQVGQDVKVRILSINKDGKINLSIKKAQEPASESFKGFGNPEGAYHGRSQLRNIPRQDNPAIHPMGEMAGPSDDADFEAKLKKFMQESDSRIADNRVYAEHRQRKRR